MIYRGIGLPPTDVRGAQNRTMLCCPAIRIVRNDVIPAGISLHFGECTRALYDTVLACQKPARAYELLVSARVLQRLINVDSGKKCASRLMATLSRVVHVPEQYRIYRMKDTEGDDDTIDCIKMMRDYEDIMKLPVVLVPPT